ncbi:MAG: hypothetical protein WAV50_02095 [Minisyncoccia bacterium]
MNSKIQIPKKFAQPTTPVHPHTIIEKVIGKSGCTPFKFFERATEVAEAVPHGFEVAAAVTDFDRFKGSRPHNLELYTPPAHVIQFAELAAAHPAVLNCFKAKPAATLRAQT